MIEVVTTTGGECMGSGTIREVDITWIGSSGRCQGSSVSFPALFKGNWYPVMKNTGHSVSANLVPKDTDVALTQDNVAAKNNEAVQNRAGK